MVLMVGTLVGLEIPLVMRILKRNTVLKDLVSQVLTFDYLGALAVSLAFPLLLVPQLGLIRTGLLFGLMNAPWRCGRCGCFAVSCAACVPMPWPALLVLGALLAGFVGADHHHHPAEDKFYQGPHRVQHPSPYQRIVVTQGKARGTGCFSMATCSSPSATNTATTKPWCTPPWRAWCARAWRCWAAATAWRCARFSNTLGRIGHPGRAGPGHDPGLFTANPRWRG